MNREIVHNVEFYFLRRIRDHNINYAGLPKTNEDIKIIYVFKLSRGITQILINGTKSTLTTLTGHSQNIRQ